MQDDDWHFVLALLQTQVEQNPNENEFSSAYSTVLHLLEQQSTCTESFLRFIPDTPVCLNLFLPYLRHISGSQNARHYLSDMLQLITDLETKESNHIFYSFYKADTSESWLEQQLAQI